MDITDEMHVGAEISSKAEVEKLETYEDRIPYYISQNYTYIPIPEEDKYFNTEEGWLRELNKRQYVSVEIHLVDVLEYLQEIPFLLINKEHNSFVAIDTRDNEVKDKSAFGALNKRLTLQEIKERIKTGDGRFFENWRTHLEDEDTEIRLIDDAVNYLKEDSDVDFIPYSERFEIITVADLNKRKMKDMLYRIFAELVSSLADRIEKEYPESDAILKYLSPDTIGRWKKEQIEGLDIHISEHLNLIGIMNVIQASDNQFVRECGFNSKEDVTVLSSINDVRNSVMHANRSLVYSRRDIDAVLGAIESSQRIISNMD